MLPCVKFADPHQFFKDIEFKAISGAFVPMWCGEMYLEFHRGTFTSQSMCKFQNRQCALFLKTAEWVNAGWAILQIYGGSPLVHKKDLQSLNNTWQKYLCTQFHDILPGSSIKKEVYDDTFKEYNDVKNACTLIINKDVSSDGMIVSACPVPRFEINQNQSGLSSLLLAAQSFDLVKSVEIKEHDNFVHYHRLYEHKKPGMFDPIFVFGNNFFEIRVNAFNASISSVKALSISQFDSDASSEYFSDRSKLMLYDDCPNSWDAWDIEPWIKQKGCELVGKIVKIYYPDDRCSYPLVSQCSICKQNSCNLPENFPCEIQVVKSSYEIGYDIEFVDATGTLDFLLTIRLNSYNPELISTSWTVKKWQTRHKLLSWEISHDFNAPSGFNVDCDCPGGGYICRPMHENTSWDRAKFEICAQNWVAIREGEAPNIQNSINGFQGRAIAFLSDWKYGFSIKNKRTYVTLLRSPKMPDSMCGLINNVNEKSQDFIRIGLLILHQSKISIKRTFHQDSSFLTRISSQALSFERNRFFLSTKRSLWIFCLGSDAMNYPKSLFNLMQIF